MTARTEWRDVIVALAVSRGVPVYTHTEAVIGAAILIVLGVALVVGMVVLSRRH